MFEWLFGSTNNGKNDSNRDIDNQGMFGIDWDGDGEVSEMDDIMTMDMLSED